jgi:flagellar biosynthesis/type III secretory pathway M-ring protein FliF/YscJ
MKPDGSSKMQVPMSAIYQQQSLAQTWKRRQRRQQILVGGVIAVLFAALICGWLYVFGIF